MVPNHTRLQTGDIVLHWPESGAQCCSIKVDSHRAQMMDANDVGDVNESALHQMSLWWSYLINTELLWPFWLS